MFKKAKWKTGAELKMGHTEERSEDCVLPRDGELPVDNTPT
jgi:hypothetical protein